MHGPPSPHAPWLHAHALRLGSQVPEPLVPLLELLLLELVVPVLLLALDVPPVLEPLDELLHAAAPNASAATAITVAAFIGHPSSATKMRDSILARDPRSSTARRASVALARRRCRRS